MDKDPELMSRINFDPSTYPLAISTLLFIDETSFIIIIIFLYYILLYFPDRYIYINVYVNQPKHESHQKLFPQYTTYTF